jgi:hypothetical protein
MEGIVVVMAASANQIYATNGMSHSNKLKQMRHLGGNLCILLSF